MADTQQHLLLVDDEQALREVIAERLGDNGYRVEQAGTGCAATPPGNQLSVQTLKPA